MTGCKFMVGFRSVFWILLFSLLNPLKSAGQSFEWAVQPSVIWDEPNLPYQQIGPGISFSSIVSSEGQFPVTSSWGISTFARSQMNGWFWGLLDPGDYGIEPSFLFGAGVYFR